MLLNDLLCKSNAARVRQQIWLLCLISALITGSVFSLSRKKGELICLLRLSKHLWVDDKNTQEAMHPKMMKPHIPLLAQIKSHLDCNSLSSSTLLYIPLIFLCCVCQTFSLQSLQSWARKQLQFLLIIIEHLLCFLKAGYDNLEYYAKSTFWIDPTMISTQNIWVDRAALCFERQMHFV